jgi:hypothetical protein
MGEPFRVKYGFAIGHPDQFNSHTGYLMTGTAGLVKQSATTVDVTNGVLFYTANTASTTITALTCTTYSINTGNQEGRIVRIVMIDNSTQFAQSGNIVLAGTGNFGLQENGQIELMQSRGKWYELSRTPYTTQDYSTVNLAGTTNCSVNADRVQTVIVTQTSTATQLSAISGGYIGQTLTIVFLNSSTSAVTLTTGGGLTFANTAGVAVINTGGALAAVKVAANTWYIEKGPVSKLG